jgi:hypothetical protein
MLRPIGKVLEAMSEGRKRLGGIFRGTTGVNPVSPVQVATMGVPRLVGRAVGLAPS